MLDQIERKWNWLGHTLKQMMTASPNRRYSGHHKATEEEDHQGILGEEIWRKKCGQQDTSTAGGRWRRQHKTELDGDKWSVACVPLGVTRHKSTQVNFHATTITFSQTIIHSRLNVTIFVLFREGKIGPLVTGENTLSVLGPGPPFVHGILISLCQHEVITMPSRS